MSNLSLLTLSIFREVSPFHFHFQKDAKLIPLITFTFNFQRSIQLIPLANPCEGEVGCLCVKLTSSVSATHHNSIIKLFCNKLLLYPSLPHKHIFLWEGMFQHVYILYIIDIIWYDVIKKKKKKKGEARALRVFACAF